MPRLLHHISARYLSYSQVNKREWKISHFEPVYEPKVGDYPRSFY